MTLALKKHFFKGDLWLMKMLNIVNHIHISKFCCLFTLRQATMLIAVVELSLTSFILFLLMLGATHAEDIVAMASADLRELEDSHWSGLDIEEPPPYITNNEKKMLNGQHLAFIIMVLVCTGLVLASIHFISCLLLLYGAIKNSPNFLLPWTSTVLLSLISGTFFLIMFAFIPLQECKLGIYAFGITFLAVELYAWLNVFSYYRQLKT